MLWFVAVAGGQGLPEDPLGGCQADGQEEPGAPPAPVQGESAALQDTVSGFTLTGNFRYFTG